MMATNCVKLVASMAKTSSMMSGQHASGAARTAFTMSRLEMPGNSLFSKTELPDFGAPKLGTYPNVQHGQPGMSILPEPSEEMKANKAEVWGGKSQMDVIKEEDEMPNHGNIQESSGNAMGI